MCSVTFHVWRRLLLLLRFLRCQLISDTQYSDERASEESLKASPALAVIVELPGDSTERE